MIFWDVWNFDVSTQLSNIQYIQFIPLHCWDIPIGRGLRQVGPGIDRKLFTVPQRNAAFQLHLLYLILFYVNWRFLCSIHAQNIYVFKYYKRRICI